jgi:hypothetical protein
LDTMIGIGHESCSLRGLPARPGRARLGRFSTWLMVRGVAPGWHRCDHRPAAGGNAPPSCPSSRVAGNSLEPERTGRPGRQEVGRLVDLLTRARRHRDPGLVLLSRAWRTAAVAGALPLAAPLLAMSRGRGG